MLTIATHRFREKALIWANRKDPKFINHCMVKYSMQFEYFEKILTLEGKQQPSSLEADVTFYPNRRRILDRLFHEEVKHPYLLTE